MRNIYFDTETTGFNFVDDRIIELAYIIEENGNIIERYDQFIKIDFPIPEDAKKVNNISDMMLKTFGIEEKDVAEAFMTAIDDGNVTVTAHNCQFDLSFIYNMLIRYYDKEYVDSIFNNINWIDSLTILRDRKVFPHKLSDGIEYYNIMGVKNSHRAIDDTEALYYLVQAMELERNDIDEYINTFGYSAKYGVSGEKFPFITYKVHPYNNVGIVSPNEILPLK